MIKDNKGFSLVELIIVIAVIGIAAGMLVGSNGFSVSQATSSLADSIKIAVGEARIKAMGKQETVLLITKDATDGKYYKQLISKVNDSVVPGEREVIGKAYPDVKFSVGGAVTNLDSSNYILIGFDRTTGKLKSVNIDINGDGMDETSVMCTNINVSGGARSINVKIVPATGKVSID